jgi:hypothetical protein
MPYDNTDYVEVPVEAPAIPKPMTQREMLVDLVDHLRTLGKGDFYMMDAWRCIGGIARQRYNLQGELREVGRHLGLSKRDAETLFFLLGGRYFSFDPTKATPKQAAKVLDHYIATGKADWGVANWWRIGKRER